MNNCDCNKHYPGVIKNMSESKCPHTCIIPSLSVETADGIKNVAACFVHVLSTNTTYYIDDQHRITKIWAGPVFVNDYDYTNNPLDLRGQSVYDFKNNREVIYNQQKGYRINTLTEE